MVTLLQPGTERLAFPYEHPCLLEDFRPRLDENEVALRLDVVEPRLSESLLHALALPDHEPGAP